MPHVRSAPTTFVGLLIFLLLFNQALVESTCFYPNGGTSKDLPCDPSGGESSVCCSEGFSCLSNGLCQDPRYENPFRLQRGACSNTGGSGCPTYCKSETPGDDEAVQYCQDGRYCCGGDSSCCDGSDILTLGEPVAYATAMQGGDPNMKTTKAPAASSTPAPAATSADTPKTVTVVQTSAPEQQTPASSAQEETPASETATANAASASVVSSSKVQVASTASDSKNASSSDVSTATPTTQAKTTKAKASKITSTAISTDSTGKVHISTVVINTTPTSTSSPAPAAAKSTNMTPIAIGVGVGCGIVIIGLVALIFFLLRRSKRRKGGRRQLESPMEMDGRSRTEIDGDSGEGRARNILPSRDAKRRKTPVFEMSAEEKPVELATGKGPNRGEMSGEELNSDLYESARPPSYGAHPGLQAGVIDGLDRKSDLR